MAANSVRTKSVKSPEVVPERLVEFFNVMLTSNPFRDARVNEPSDAVPDAVAVHQSEFEALRESAVGAYEGRKALGVMLLGGAGVGKSHLLARLWRWADHGHRALFVYLHNVLASPAGMSRHLLRSVMSILVEGRESYADSKLYELIAAFAKMAIHAQGLPNRLTPTQARIAFLQMATGLDIRSDRINEPVFKVLFKMFEKIKTSPGLKGPARDAVDAVVEWLSGNSISADMAKEIGLSPKQEDKDEEGLIRLSDEHHIEQVLLIIAELAHAAGRPVVICLDQVDNLVDEQVKCLSRFLHALLDHAHNLLVVTSGVRQTMVEHFKEHQIIGEASWDRLAEKTIELRRIDAGQARDVLMSRLDPLQKRFQTVPELSSLLHKEHGMFPIAESDFEYGFGQSLSIRPRELITWASEKWQAEQRVLRVDGALKWLKEWPEARRVEPPKPEVPVETMIDAKVQEAIIQCVAERRGHKGSLPPSADNLTTLIEALLTHCVGREQYSVRRFSRVGGTRPPYHLKVVEKVHGGEGQVITGVAVVATRDGRASNGALRRLLNADEVDARLLVTDEDRMRLPLPSEGKRLYDKLTALGPRKFLHVKLDFQTYIELDAMQSVVSQARVGDLEIEYPARTMRKLKESEVVESLHRLDRFRQHILLRELITEPSKPPPEPPPSILPEPSDDELRKIIMGNLAWRISITTEALTPIVLDKFAHGAQFAMVHARVMSVARGLEELKKVITKPHGDGLLLLMP